MIDLTGASLISYLLRVVADVANRNPRFRDSGGVVKPTFSNKLAWRDMQVMIKDVTTSGNRLSPNYFMCNQYGRAILAKIEGKDGGFIEWVNETDASRLTPDSGVYYLNVDAVNVEDNQIDLTIQKYRWLEGSLKNAVGSLIYFAPEVNTATLELTDATTGRTLVQGVDYAPYKGYFVLYTPVVSLTIAGLTPLIGYWYERTHDIVLFPTTTMGSQSANLPAGVMSFTLTDQTGYELRPGIDFTIGGRGLVQLSQWTPAGSTVTAHILTKVSPATSSAIHPENALNLSVEDLSNLVVGQGKVHTPDGVSNSLTMNSDGSISLPTCLRPGDWMRWEVRIDDGKTQAKAKKYDLNGNVIPGLYLAIGDIVTVGDQCSILVSPSVTQTYEVYGSKENLTFSMEIKANDLQTASELSEAIKQYMLVLGRESMESDGLTVFESPRGYQGESRDASGTAPSFTYTLNFSASADWKVFVPLITRITNFEITTTPGFTDFPGKLENFGGKIPPRIKTFGATQFLISYS